MIKSSKPLAILAGLALLASACGASNSDEGAASSASTTAATTTTEATTTSTPLTTAPPATESEGGSTTDPGHLDDDITWEAVDAALTAKVEELGLNGAGLRIVTPNGGVVHSVDVGEFTSDRVSLVASASKMLASGILLSLSDAGVIDLDAPVASIVEWGSSNPDITTAQLMSNSSGLVSLTDNPTFGPYICQYVADGSLQDCATAIFTTAEDDDLIIEPDTEFKYGGGQWQVAGAVAEVVSGKSWAELVQEVYIEPCGVDSLAFNNHWAQITSDAGPFSHPPFNSDPSLLVDTDNPNIEGGAYISADDYAVLLQMHLNGGFCGETQVLSQTALDLAHGDRIGSVYGGSTGSGNEGYGLGWWVDRDDPFTINDGGAFGAIPWLNFEGEFGVYLVVEATSGIGGQIRADLEPLINEVFGL